MEAAHWRMSLMRMSTNPFCGLILLGSDASRRLHCQVLLGKGWTSEANVWALAKPRLMSQVASAEMSRLCEVNASFL
jgi:hypothetical protein